MRAVIQRVYSASVSVDSETVGAIDRGLLVFLGVGQGDTSSDADWLVSRIVKLRVFENEPGRMDCSLVDIEGGALVISQFTLFGSLRKGNRPSFNRAANPDHAESLYGYFIEELSKALGRTVPSGRFGQHMRIKAVNDGPVTLIVDSQQREF